MYVATINTLGYLPETEPAEFESAAEAWWFLYHERCEYERDYINETGLCDGCGEPYDDGHDADSEVGVGLSSMAKRGVPGVLVGDTLGGSPTHDLGIAYSVIVAE